MVEEAKQGGGEEAGGDPPSEEREEGPEEQGAEDSPQAPQSDRQLGDRRPRSRLDRRGRRRGRLRRIVRVNFIETRQVFFRMNPPGVSACKG